MFHPLRRYYKIGPLLIFLPRISAYRRDFDKTICMTLLIKDVKILKKYNEIWQKVTKIIYKEVDSNPVYNEKYIETKIKVYVKKVNTNFHGNKIPIESLECVCLSLILLDAVYRKNNKYFPQVFLEECKDVVTEKKIHNYIIDDLEISSDEEDLSEKNPYYEENSDKEKSSDEEIKYKFFSGFLERSYFRAWAKKGRVLFSKIGQGSVLRKNGGFFFKYES